MTTAEVLPSSSLRPSRRTVLAGAGAMSAAVLVRGSGSTASAVTGDAVVHLLRRATYGPTPSLVAAVRSAGATAWLDAQLDPARVPDPVMDALLPRWPKLGLRTWECREQMAYGNSELNLSLLECHMARALWSERHLLEIVVNFWTNHLVVPVPSTEAWDNAHLYQRDVIRPNALGRYADMLLASVRHPALLNVLGNAKSSKKSPNENHGRELLELHTVGVGNFTEADVKQSALALTGLGVDQDNGLYEYKPERRYVGPLTVLGWSDPNGSAEGGERVVASYLTYLARHPRTAARIATKLCIRFVSDAPPAGLVDRLAGVYLANDTAVAPVLKALFTSTEFAESVGQKVKTPYEDALSTIRIMETRPEESGTSELRNLLWLVRAMGEAPMGWPAPNGYPDVAAAWSSSASTLARWNFHYSFAGGWSLPKLPRPALASLVPAERPATYDALLTGLATRLLMPPLSAVQKAAVCTYLGKKVTDPLVANDAAIGWRLKDVVGLLLDSFNFNTR